ncbi:MAG TPA: sigma-70 family RNA polymerase sigma factor [Gemmataceae bacterium]|nr:sigma-70 family RNA polymerase sigma factor [Gemmataceae bacterium]
MKSSPANRRQAGRRPYVVAMVLGTALSALGPVAGARAEAVDATARAINDMSRYCSTCWRNASLPADCWTDCTQEVFSRLLERVAPDAWGWVFRREGEERREFLRAIDTVKKRWQRGRKWSAGAINAVADRREQEARRLREQRQAVEQAAEELLTPRQQRILHLSFQGWTVQDIARELRTPAERISDEKYKAIRKLRAYLHEGGEDAQHG